MTKRFSNSPAAIAGAVGSAAIAASLLYVSHRRERKKERAAPGSIPSGEKPETD